MVVVGQGLLPGLGYRQLLAVAAEHFGEHANRVGCRGVWYGAAEFAGLGGAAVVAGQFGRGAGTGREVGLLRGLGAGPVPLARQLRVPGHRRHGDGAAAVRGVRGLQQRDAGPAAGEDRRRRRGRRRGGPPLRAQPHPRYPAGRRAGRGHRSATGLGGQTLQASLTALQSAAADPHGTTYTPSASLFDLVEQRLAAPGSSGGRAHLAQRDPRLIDEALAELAGALGMDITSYDTGPVGDPAPSAAPGRILRAGSE